MSHALLGLRWISWKVFKAYWWYPFSFGWTNEGSFSFSHVSKWVWAATFCCKDEHAAWRHSPFNFFFSSRGNLFNTKMIFYICITCQHISSHLNFTKQITRSTAITKTSPTQLNYISSLTFVNLAHYGSVKLNSVYVHEYKFNNVHWLHKINILAQNIYLILLGVLFPHKMKE